MASDGRELIYFSTRLVDQYWLTRSGGRLHRRVGLRRLLSVTPRVSVGLPPAQVSIEPTRARSTADMQDRYDQLRRAVRKDVIEFPGQPIPPRGRPPVIEFTLDARWGLMPFLGVGVTPNEVFIDGHEVDCLWTFWLEGAAADGSITVLIGSADNLLSVDPSAFRDSDRLRPGFNYPSATEGLTALVRAVSPQMRTHVPEDEWAEISLREVDIARFALDAPRRDDSDLDIALEENEIPRWELRHGTVRGLARVYASVDAAEIKADSPTYGWLADDATVVVGAPYVIQLA
jgi:hypothetical protein